MNKDLLKLYPHDLWENFANLCDCPHPSKHEDAAIKWMKQWAKDHKVKVEQDKTGNLLFTIPATKGMEKLTPVILQGHTDMVPQADDPKFDFLKSPIEPIIDKGWVRANRTTLGADNGIGVCAALACVTTSGVKHGPMEILVTVDEETGMTGAFGLKKGFVKGKILISFGFPQNLSTAISARKQSRASKRKYIQRGLPLSLSVTLLAMFLVLALITSTLSPEALAIFLSSLSS